MLHWTWGADTSLRYWFHFLQKCTSKRDYQVKYSFILKLSSSLHTVFHKGYTNLRSHQQSKKSPFSSHPCQQFIFCLFHKSHSNRCEVISQSGFDWHFPVDQWCWAPSCVDVSSGPLLTFLLSYLHFWCWVVWVLCIFGILIPCQICHLQISSPMKSEMYTLIILMSNIN